MEVLYVFSLDFELHERKSRGYGQDSDYMPLEWEQPCWGEEGGSVPLTTLFHALPGQMVRSIIGSILVLIQQNPVIMERVCLENFEYDASRQCCSFVGKTDSTKDQYFGAWTRHHGGVQSLIWRLAAVAFELLDLSGVPHWMADVAPSKDSRFSLLSAGFAAYWLQQCPELRVLSACLEHDPRKRPNLSTLCSLISPGPYPREEHLDGPIRERPCSAICRYVIRHRQQMKDDLEVLIQRTHSTIQEDKARNRAAKPKKRSRKAEPTPGDPRDVLKILKKLSIDASGEAEPTVHSLLDSSKRASPAPPHSDSPGSRAEPTEPTLDSIETLFGTSIVDSLPILGNWPDEL